MTIELKKDGRIATITLNRPEALNALDPASVDELSKVMTEFRDDDNLWVAIVTGSGEKAFCAGADIVTTLPKLKAERGQPWKATPTPMRGIEIWKPMVAAINGAALGGGLELALTCDIRIASEKAVFGVPEVRLGLIPGWGGTQRLPRAIGMAKAAEMLLTGKSIDAQEALRIGLINKVVPPAEVMSSAVQMASVLCEPSPLAIRAAKQAMVQGIERSLNEGLELEMLLEDNVLITEDFIEGTTAFMSKRKASFKAR
ncbi:MAG: enoyl-CoA hydratase/isomerase family protein [Chloroflexi bacterium]|nr:enoyl-CoA hydratase/isomerase family protein [Chloroflexota bacterium]